MEIYPGIELVGGEEPHQYNANSYLIGATLFDCGSTEGGAQLTASLAGRTPARIIATHAHRDHVQAARTLPVPLWMPASGVDAVVTGDYLQTGSFLYDRPFLPLTVARPLGSGDRISLECGLLHVLPTPGHSPCSTCYLLERPGYRVLIAGDTVWGGYHGSLGSDLKQWRRSLDLLAGLEFDVLLPGHGTMLPHSKEALLRSIPWFGRELRPSFGAMRSPWGRPRS